ncbi:hypothetical protein RND71_026791 [Anisodus tanguticus]|uniref:Uncharacterized protein n=1 Tax=Anisodus tanguticus TaxID=243964 RepID=A0AAE1RNZ8_9SOLA|nr:hypothetical protein RND71_026791 [Anisodus tanguticus]
MALYKLRERQCDKTLAHRFTSQFAVALLRSSPSPSPVASRHYVARASPSPSTHHHRHRQSPLSLQKLDKEIVVLYLYTFTKSTKKNIPCTPGKRKFEKFANCIHEALNSNLTHISAPSHNTQFLLRNISLASST